MSQQDEYAYLRDPHAALRVLLQPAAFSDQEVGVLASLCEVVHCPAGTVLIREGDPPDPRVYFLLQGSVSVSIGGRFILRLQNRGDTVGEMGLISAAPRSATVETDGPATLLAVNAGAAADEATDTDYKFRYYLSRLFNSILTEKLRRTSHRAQLYEDMASRSREAEQTAGELQEQIAEYLRDISLYTHLVNSAGDAIIVADVDGRVLTANAALREAFGLEPTEAAGRRLSELLGLDASDGHGWETMARAAREGGWRGELLVHAGAGAPTPAECAVSVVDDPRSGHLAYSAILRNIRVRKAQQEQILQQSRELEQAYRELQSLERAKSNFLTLVSHQLRTPITAIMAYAETLSMEGMVEPEEQGEFIRVIHQEAEKLGEMVNKVLAISKMESGQMLFQFGPADLPAVVHSQVAALRPRAEEKGLALVLDEETMEGPVICDEAQVTEAVRQILDNAIRYTDTGEVRVVVRQTKDEALIRIADTGKGIEGNEVETLLDTFSRGDAIDPRGYGLGLGLPLSYLIVKAHSGRLRLEGNPGRGTTVSIEIPVRPPEQAGSGTPALDRLRTQASD